MTAHTPLTQGLCQIVLLPTVTTWKCPGARVTLRSPRPLVQFREGSGIFVPSLHNRMLMNRDRAARLSRQLVTEMYNNRAKKLSSRCTEKSRHKWKVDLPVKFYCFPSSKCGATWKDDKRIKWINAVKNYVKNPKEWEPNQHTRICSAHFINNSKSDNSHHPSYVPSIFPGKENTRNSIQRLQRFERSRTRQLNKDRLIYSITSSVNSNNCIGDKNINNTSDIAMEQDAGGMITEAQDDCHRDVNVMNVSPPAYRSITCQTEDFIPDISTDDVTCDPINFESIQSHCKGFHGFSSITSDETISSFTGVTLSIFSWLLNKLPEGKSSPIDKKNKIIHYISEAKNRFDIYCDFTAVRATLPESFKLHYPDTRVIIDCTEVNTEVPPAVKHRVLMYSDYKHHHTMKFLVGCTPSGFISFLSKCYGGRAGDCFITNDCGLVDLIEPDDVVLADKGFPQIQTRVQEKNEIFVMPPFCNKNQFTPEEVDETYNIASVRIHIERVNQRIKDFNILSKVPVSLLPHVDEIVFVICAIINIQKPLFNQEKSVTE
ncbi:uncharacterized protein LOC124416171 [Diprion similis]|uniref:uncharacterized protein LOC124416171 n=1 Tax=Diprion similis TaxID=362088 RepID=UPI001EF87AD5|nr:uncharacterized protein LOC124416171 [Diprion similis]